MDEKENKVLAVYDTRCEAERAMIRLVERGYDIGRLSILEKDFLTVGKTDVTLEPTGRYASELKAAKIILLAKDSLFDIQSAYSLLDINFYEEDLTSGNDPIIRSGGEHSPFQ